MYLNCCLFFVNMSAGVRFGEFQNIFWKGHLLVCKVSAYFPRRQRGIDFFFIKHWNQTWIPIAIFFCIILFSMLHTESRNDWQWSNDLCPSFYLSNSLNPSCARPFVCSWKKIFGGNLRRCLTVFKAKCPLFCLMKAMSIKCYKSDKYWIAYFITEGINLDFFIVLRVCHWFWMLYWVRCQSAGFWSSFY